MNTIVGVRFKPTGKLYFFDAHELCLSVGDEVIVDTIRGPEYAIVSKPCSTLPSQQSSQPLRAVLRLVNQEDRQILESNRKRADKAFAVCKERIEAHQLAMNLVSAECTFDRSKMLFYFTADGRIDFRELVRDLAGMFRTRIELRQIGVRDKAKMVGGIGICGRELCCSSYLNDFHSVSINMAKDQNLSLNPSKISGVCGRLMCCLKYEQAAYADLQKTTPRVGSVVDTPEGRGKVVSTQMLRGTCKVQLDHQPERTLTEFSCSDCCRTAGGGCCRARDTESTSHKKASHEASPAHTGDIVDAFFSSTPSMPKKRKRSKRHPKNPYPTQE